MDYGSSRQPSWPTEADSVVMAFAEVVDASEGRANRVVLDDTTPTELPVSGHVRDLSPLSEGDRVVVLVDASRASAFVHSCCAAPGEPPRLGLECRPDGTYVLDADHRDIRLEVNGAVLELRRDGRIVMDGEEVTSRARGEARILGRRIGLN